MLILLWALLIYLRTSDGSPCQSGSRFPESVAIGLYTLPRPFATSIVNVGPTLAITTVSRFFSDKFSGAVVGRLDSSGESSPTRRRSLLQRLHIQTSDDRGKYSTPARPPTAPAATSGGSSSTTTVRSSRSQPDATIEDITKIMPQSLIVSTPPRSSSTKRQRSADSRMPHPHPRSTSAGRNGSNVAGSGTGRTPLKPNVRIPAYLEKSKSGK